MTDLAGVIGYFPNADALHEGIEAALKAGAVNASAYLPIPDQPAVEQLQPDPSPVRWFALAGGLTGIATALAMTIWMSWNYPLVVGGKPITSLPPFLVVSFELMILFGSIACVAGFMWYSRLPDLTPSQPYRPPMAVDHYTLFIPGDTEFLCERSRRVLREAGAQGIEDVYRSERGRLEALL